MSLKCKQKSNILPSEKKNVEKDEKLASLQGPPGLQGLVNVEGIEGANLAKVATLANLEGVDSVLEAMVTEEVKKNEIEKVAGKQGNVEKRRRKNNFDLNTSMNVVS